MKRSARGSETSEQTLPSRLAAQAPRPRYGLLRFAPPPYSTSQGGFITRTMRCAIFVWGGASSVGSNAIQLAHCSGYRVVTTCSPHNVDYVRSLGADAAVDYHDAHAVDEIIAAIDGTPLAGAFTVTRRSVRATIDVAARAPGTARVASAQTAVLTRVQALRSSHRNVPVTAIWGGSLKDNEVGPGIYASFLPDALSSGTFRPAPAPGPVTPYARHGHRRNFASISSVMRRAALPSANGIVRCSRSS